MRQAHLLRHADSRCPSVRALTARVHALRAQVMGVQFTLLGDLRGIRIPQGGAAARADQLWRHTCFEAFVSCEDVPGYLELNFSPSGAWQAYRFSAYRQGVMPAQVPPPNVTVGYRERAGASGSAASADEALVLEALIRLPAPYAEAPRGLHLALGAVVEDEAGALSYWALRHAPGRPDFHHPDAFALTLEWT